MKNRVALITIISLIISSSVFGQEKSWSLNTGIGTLQTRGIAFSPYPFAIVDKVSTQTSFPIVPHVSIVGAFQRTKIKYGFGLDLFIKHFDNNVNWHRTFQDLAGPHTIFVTQNFSGKYYIPSFLINADYLAMQRGNITIGPAGSIGFSSIFYTQFSGQNDSKDLYTENFITTSIGAFGSYRVNSFSFDLKSYCLFLPWQRENVFVNNKVQFYGTIGVTYYLKQKENSTGK